MGFIGKQPTPVPLTSSDITDNIITTDKIVDDAVTGPKLSNSPVIADGLTLTDGNLVVASGHGISFGATANASGTGATMSNELLDDYEEGTWTPTIHGGFTSVTIDYLKANYIRIGKHCSLYCSMRFAGTNAGANFVIGGLPFTAETAANNFGNGTGAIGYSTLTTYLNSSISTCYIGQGGSLIYFYNMSGSGVASNANASSDWMEFSAHYPVQ
tara:strand:- start:1495 stop:2136 length:642 start_codon:yes stop_codon:yes gene_type:complete